MSSRSVVVRLSVQAQTAGLDSYREKMDRARQSTDNMKTSSEESRSGFDGVGRAIAGAFTVGAALKIAQMGVQMTNLGRGVSANKQIFDELAGSMGNAGDIMDSLREASLGQASDNDLRTGANLLMRMNIANSPEELEQVIGLITRLKSPTKDLGDEINNFSLMLSNQSLLRLDSFGLSSGRVKQRMEELREAGIALTREDAFRMATFEEMEKAVDRLGGAAEAGATALGRLETGFQNWTEELGANVFEQVENAAIGFEGIVGIAQVALGQNPIQIQQREAAEKALSEFVDSTMNAALVRSDITLDPGVARQYVESVYQALQESPELAGDMPGLRLKATQILTGNFNMTEAAFGEEGGLAGEGAQMIALNTIALEAQARRDVAAGAQEQAAALAALEDVEMQRMMASQERFAQEQQMREAGFLRGDLQELQALAAFEMPEFMTSEQAASFTEAAGRATELVEEMEALAEIDPTLFTAEEIENAKATAKEVADVAKEAERAADAFAKIKLTDVFGQTGGGLAGEVSDLVVTAAKDAGASEEELAALQREMNLASGRETVGSLALQEQIAPMVAAIAAEQGPEMAAAVSVALAQALGQAALAGIDTNSEDFITTLTNEVTENGGGFDPTAFVEGYATLEDPAANVAASMEATNTAAMETAGALDAIQEDTTVILEDAAVMQTNFEGAQEAAGGMRDSLSEVATSLTTIKSLAGDFKSQLSEISGQKWRLYLDLEANDPLNLIGFLSKFGFENTLARAVGDNGGTVPGSLS